MAAGVKTAVIAIASKALSRTPSSHHNVREVVAVAEEGEDAGARERIGRPNPRGFNLADRLQMASGLFFGLYLLTHLVHQATAAVGRETYEAFSGKLGTNGALAVPGIEIVFVWLPLLVHLAATAAIRIHSREIRGSLRKRISVGTGYLVLLIVPFHIWFTRFAPVEQQGYDLILKRMGEEGILFYGYLVAFTALAILHVAAGSINTVHQVVRDREKRKLLDRAIIVAGVVLFLAVVVGVFSFAAPGP